LLTVKHLKIRNAEKRQTVRGYEQSGILEISWELFQFPPEPAKLKSLIDSLTEGDEFEVSLFLSNFPTTEKSRTFESEAV
jgi:hypothetical protein